MKKILEELRIIRIRANGLSRRKASEDVEAEEAQWADDNPEFLARKANAVDGIRAYLDRG